MVKKESTPNKGGYVYAGAFKRFLKWAGGNAKEGVPFNPLIEEVPEEFRCFI